MDSTHHTRTDDRRARIPCVLLLLVFGLIVVEPLRMRAKGPSIYADDVVRIAQVRTMPLARMVVRPFNEHLAPLFELETAAVWSLCDERLTHAPLAFTLASLLPFLLCEIALFALLRRETGSLSASLASVAVFGVTWLPIETAWWYSASSFAWSLLGVLIAWRAMLSPGPRGLGVAVAAALAAPAFSMIGILAGPVALLRGAIDGFRRERRWRSLLPMAGTAGYLVLVALVGDRQGLSGSVRRNVHPGEALGPILRAPATVLLPALAGVKSLDAAIPPRIAGAITVAAAGLLIVLVARRRLSAGLVVGGLGLIALGYGLTYAARAGTPHVLTVQRYHLFPHAGLSLIVGAIVARLGLAQRIDRRPVQAVTVGMLVALVLLVTHRSELKGRARHLRFDGQAATLAAMEHVEQFRASRNLPRESILASLVPIRKSWFDFDLNALTMIAPAGGDGTLSPKTVRAEALTQLSSAEREALWGGMNATGQASRQSGTDSETCLAEGRLDGVHRISPPLSEIPEGPSYLEFVTNLPDADGREPRTLLLGGLPASGMVEIWWNRRDGRWREGRSIRLDTAALAQGSDPVTIPLQALPHWNPRNAERLRIRLQGPGRIGLIAPKFYR